MTEIVEPATPRGLISGYRPIPGVYDEMFREGGECREHGQKMLAELTRLGAGELDRRFRQAEKLVRDDGVTFNTFDESGESSRPWNLDIVPAMLSRDDFHRLDQALVQRATLLEKLLDDLFGPQKLLREKVIPAELILGHPGFQRAYHNLQPPNRRRLTIYAADLARSPDGRWWVTGDRVRAPSGLGFILENRIVTSRVLPGVFRAARPRRLAPFFVRLRETLRENAPRHRQNPRTVILSRGADSPTYFEDVYLARYLGYTLAEGGDLATRNGRIMLKTLGGLLPVEVIFRRVSDDDCDPVELNSASLTGVSGLVDVVRNDEVVVANALGSRLAETPALVPFLPAACRMLLGEDLRLPSAATWWCGQARALTYVLENLDKLVIRSAYKIKDTPSIEAALLTQAARNELVEKLKARPSEFVAQERIVRSTVPVWLGSTIEPWHSAFRFFVSADGDSFLTLPGGLARASPDRLSLDRSMAAGERAQDVWIESDGPEEPVSLLRSSDEPLVLKRSGNDLPSRDAENLFWLGRMIERADGAARGLRVLLRQVTDDANDESNVVRTALVRALAALGQIEPGFAVDGLKSGLPDLQESVPGFVFNTQDALSLKSTMDSVARLVNTVRDRLSIDAWLTLNQLQTDWTLSPGQRRKLDSTALLQLLQRVVTAVAQFGGLSSEGMTRTQVWRFLELGRRIERVWHTATILQSTLVEVADPEPFVLEAVLESCDSIMTYRGRYLSTLQAEAVIDLLATDDTNPRSLIFQLNRIQDHVSRLPSAGQAVLGPDERLAMSLHNAVRLAEPRELAQADDSRRQALDRLMQRLLDQIPKLSNAISQRYLIHAGLPRQFDRESI
ncbi:MAG: circularly permuted type 2 ATP-grasp protein [Planctomycetota bacterium]|nr:circularly permuted type 2 ATP-grasp protein [Planctomycetota bacterium]MDA1161464.1 circularly permuted type 2 ATP-grasp protein [Planctomycetota bacterium]